MSYMKMGSIDLLFDYIACFTSPDCTLEPVRGCL